MNLPADASQDQSNCPPDYYRRNNGMLHQLPPNNAVIHTQPSLSAEEMEELLTDDNKLRAMAKKKLIQIIYNAPATPILVNAINVLWDRIDGKPGQAVTLDANLRVVTVNANIEFIQSVGDKVIDGEVKEKNIIDNQ